jgi:hypothetical protein
VQKSPSPSFLDKMSGKSTKDQALGGRQRLGIPAGAIVVFIWPMGHDATHDGCSISSSAMVPSAITGHAAAVSPAMNSGLSFDQPICGGQQRLRDADPEGFAVSRFIANSNFVGCSTGRSAGFAPLKILCTGVAACRN